MKGGPDHPESIELLERLGRNDPCPCGSGKRFQELLPEVRAVRWDEPAGLLAVRWPKREGEGTAFNYVARCGGMHPTYGYAHPARLKVMDRMDGAVPGDEKTDPLILHRHRPSQETKLLL